ncbi:unnamed protein product, partial [Amoebophrya sp. A25]
ARLRRARVILLRRARQMLRERRLSPQEPAFTGDNKADKMTVTSVTSTVADPNYDVLGRQIMSRREEQELMKELGRFTSKTSKPTQAKSKHFRRLDQQNNKQ